jgi:hypothetical protein
MVEERHFRAAKSVLKKWALASALFIFTSAKARILGHSRGPEGPLFHRFFTLKREEKMFCVKILGCNLDNIA